MKVLSQTQLRAIIEAVTKAIEKALDETRAIWVNKFQGDTFKEVAEAYDEVALAQKEYDKAQEKLNKAKHNISTILEKHKTSYWRCPKFENFVSQHFNNAFEDYVEKNFPKLVLPRKELIRSEVLLATLKDTFDLDTFIEEMKEKYVPNIEQISDSYASSKI